MTTERVYICNLCRDRILPAEGGKEGFGVYFDTGGDHIFKRASECENHICLQCATNVQDNLRAVTPAE